MLTIAIFDKDALSSDDFLGSAEVNLTQEFRGQWIDHEISKHFVLEDPEMRIKPKARRLRHELVKSRRDKKWSDAPLGRVHLQIGFHPDLETAGRDRGISVMNLADITTGNRSSVDVGVSTENMLPQATRDSRDSRDAAR